MNVIPIFDIFQVFTETPIFSKPRSLLEIRKYTPTPLITSNVGKYPWDLEKFRPLIYIIGSGVGEIPSYGLYIDSGTWGDYGLWPIYAQALELGKIQSSPPIHRLWDLEKFRAPLVQRGRERVVIYALGRGKISSSSFIKSSWSKHQMKRGATGQT